LPELEPGGHRQHHAAIDRRHLDRRADHRFRQGDRQIEPHIIAVAREEAVRLHGDRHDRVAMPAGALLALAGKAHLRAGLDADRELEIDRLAIGKRDALRLERGGIGKRNAEAIGDVGAARLLLIAAAETEAAGKTAAAAALCTTPEQPFEDIAHIGFAAAEIELLAMLAIGAEPACPRATRSETIGRGRIAVTVDLTAIEAGTLVLVGQQVIGRGDLRKPFRCLGIVLVAVRMQLLGELAIRLLDVRLARGALHAQYLIGIRHSCPVNCISRLCGA
jgi:hypothetical protein